MHAPRGLRPICSPVNASVQVHEVAREVLLVVPPRQAVHTRRGMLFESIELRFKQGGVDVVQERGELLFLPLPCS